MNTEKENPSLPAEEWVELPSPESDPCPIIRRSVNSDPRAVRDEEEGALYLGAHGLDASLRVALPPLRARAVWRERRMTLLGLDGLVYDTIEYGVPLVPQRDCPVPPEAITETLAALAEGLLHAAAGGRWPTIDRRFVRWDVSRARVLVCRCELEERKPQGLQAHLVGQLAWVAHDLTGRGVPGSPPTCSAWLAAWAAAYPGPVTRRLPPRPALEIPEPALPPPPVRRDSVPVLEVPRRVLPSIVALGVMAVVAVVALLFVWRWLVESTASA